MKKWDTVDEVHRTVDIPEAPKVGASGKPKVDKSGIPLPPPPPPAHLLKQLHVDTKHGKDNEREGGSPVSSFYSPGITQILLKYFRQNDLLYNTILS